MAPTRHSDPDDRYRRVRVAVAGLWPRLSEADAARLALRVMETDRTEEIARRLLEER